MCSFEKYLTALEGYYSLPNGHAIPTLLMKKKYLITYLQLF